MILANISTPLLGFVDTAVVGHLSNSAYLAGTALGGLVISVMVWLLGFLRMSTTGLVAQAMGTKQPQVAKRTVQQGLFLGLVISAIILVNQSSIFSLLLVLVNQSGDVSDALMFAKSYFEIRIWAMPLVLTNLVFTGFLIAMGRTKLILVTVILCNLVNLVADLVLVVGLQWQVEGVAYAAVLAECIQTALLSYFVIPLLLKQRSTSLAFFDGVTRLLRLNRDLFIRSLFLQLCLSFIAIYATNYGETAVAINAILMQFFLFISFVLDGVAYGLESLLGQAKGRRQVWKQKLFIVSGCQIGFIAALVYTLFYVVLAESIISLLTNLPELKVALNDYLVWIYLMPLISFLSFIYDGIFIGLTMIKAMRNSMFVAAVVFFLVFNFSQTLGNQGLWLAFMCFMLARGTSQWLMLKRYHYF